MACVDVFANMQPPKILPGGINAPGLFSAILQASRPVPSRVFANATKEMRRRQADRKLTTGICSPPASAQ
jgi:hypothetical protein